MTQQQLGELLGLDQSYVCRIENGRRAIHDVPTLERIASRLGLPPRLLGLVTARDHDFEAMCQFAESTLRLAEVARHAGRPMEAVREVWPLVVRLESRAADSPADRDVLVLLAGSCLVLGTALGDVLPEEQLRISVRWTRRALQISEWLRDQPLVMRALNLHGNELRKSGDHRAAIAHLARALEGGSGDERRGDTLLLLARAQGEMGDAHGFDRTMHDAESLLQKGSQSSPLFNAFSIQEAHVRGLLSTGRADLAWRLVSSGASLQLGPVRPQWQVMERITVAGVLATGGDLAGAVALLSVAIAEAETCSLPHQIQRALRMVGSVPGEPGVHLRSTAASALARLRDVPCLPPAITGVGAAT